MDNTAAEPILEQTPQPSITIGMLLCPDFNGMAAHAFIDPFRAANYVHGGALYQWQYLSLRGDTVIASNGMVVKVTHTFSQATFNFDILVINASWAPERFQNKKLQSWLSQCCGRGTLIVGLDTGPFVMAFARLLDGYSATVHYEHTEAFRELFSRTKVEQQLFVVDHNRVTCCGGLASADLALELIRHRHGLDMANAAAQYIFLERLRAGEEEQLSRAHEPVGYALPEKMREAILLMERNLEEPLRLPEISQHLDLSQRQLERMFQHYTSITPMRYYINFRLDRARGLITQTEMSIAEISSACGFSSAEHLSRAYKKRFDIAPSKDRIEGRIPFQFRTFPRYAGI